MSSSVSSFLGYGWVLDRYEVCPFLPEEDDSELYSSFYSSDKYQNWWNEVEASDFYKPLNGYDDSYFFFGIKMSLWVDPGEVEFIDETPPAECGNWDDCVRQFNKYFASCNKPHMMVVSILW